MRTIMHAIQLMIYGPKEGEMLCSDVGPLLSEFIDEEVDAATLEKIKAHLDMCAPCRKFMESLEKTSRMLRSDPSLQISEDAAKQMMEKLRAEYQRAREGLGGHHAQ
ncbi:MAG: anti-sigma factor [bacterium]|nr:anti-sigma factor [bacterium]